MHLVDELIHAVGEFFRVHIPVTKACSVVISSDEPAVVHDEKLHAHGGGPVCQLDLLAAANRKSGGIPGIIENRKGLICQLPGYQLLQGKRMKGMGHFFKTAV